MTDFRNVVKNYNLDNISQYKEGVYSPHVAHVLYSYMSYKKEFIEERTRRGIINPNDDKFKWDRRCDYGAEIKVKVLSNVAKLRNDLAEFI